MVTSLYIFIILCYDILSEAGPTSATPILAVDRHIQAFGGDVPVTVTAAQVGSIVQLFYHNEREAITAQMMTKQTETLVFNCGYFFKTGSYLFKLKSPDGKYLPPIKTVVARDYPRITLDWTREHRTLSTDVKVSMKVRGTMCGSDIARQNSLALRLNTLANRTEGFHGKTTEVTRNFTISTIPNVFIPSYSVLPCETFNSAGRYQVELVVTSPRGYEVTLSKSDPMVVDWSPNYNIRLRKDSFPCAGIGVTVTLTTPPCASQSDQIRLLSVHNGTMTTMASRLKRNNDQVNFACDVFYDLNVMVDGFCFQYVTETGHVTRTICEPSGRDSGFRMNGSWSPWTEWSTCERPCQNSVKRRKRLCNNPVPRGRGNLCLDEQGKPSKEEILVVKGAETSSQGCDSEIISSQYVERCRCGCTIAKKGIGQIVSPLHGDCHDDSALIWMVEAPVGKAIKFEVKDDQLSNDEKLTIKIDRNRSYRMTSHFPVVTSQRNSAIVQLARLHGESNLNSCGFVLGFQIVDAPSTPSPEITTDGVDDTGDDVITWIQNAVTQNPVVVIGIGACVVIIVLAIIMVAVHRRRKGKRKIPVGLRTPMNPRLAMPPDGRSCSNADDTESEPMVRPRPIGNSGNINVNADSCMPAQSAAAASSTAYYLAQRQLEIMKRLGKDQHAQSYATGCLSEEAIREQEELLFGDRKSLHKNQDLKVT